LCIRGVVYAPFMTCCRAYPQRSRLWTGAKRIFIDLAMSSEATPKIVAMIVGSAVIMQQLDSTVITTALPQMAVSLHADPVQLSVAVTAYILSLAVFIPVSGWAADRFGGRTVFRAAIAIFTLGSVLCG